MFGKDNEKTIDRALYSVKPFADEILYLDTGSTDKTLEIVRRYTRRVYIVENMLSLNNSNYRNFLNSEATSLWTLFLDTDEVITHGVIKNIKSVLESLGSLPHIHHVYFKMCNLIYDEQHMLTSPDFHPFLYHPRLALKKFARWEGNRNETYVGEGEGFFWDTFGIVHYNLLDTDRLQMKFLRDNSLYWHFSESEAREAEKEDILKIYIGQANIGTVPKDVTW